MLHGGMYRMVMLHVGLNKETRSNLPQSPNLASRGDIHENHVGTKWQRVFACIGPYPILHG